MFSYKIITDPNTNREYSITTKKGRKLMKKC